MSAISGVSSQLPVQSVQSQLANSTKPATANHQDTVNISETARQAAAGNSGAQTGVDVDNDGDHS